MFSDEGDVVHTQSISFFFMGRPYCAFCLNGINKSLTVIQHTHSIIIVCDDTRGRERGEELLLHCCTTKNIIIICLKLSNLGLGSEVRFGGRPPLKTPSWGWRPVVHSLRSSRLATQFQTGCAGSGSVVGTSSTLAQLLHPLP